MQSGSLRSAWHLPHDTFTFVLTNICVDEHCGSVKFRIQV
jgi:hypothetical protein